MAVVLKLDGVSKSFARVEKNDITNALENINLEMHSGEFISLVGTSGCGKSTMLRLIAGLITPTTGTLTVNGEKIEGPVDLGVEGYTAMTFRPETTTVLEGQGWITITAENVDSFGF